MKIERTVLALMIAAVTLRAASMYYAYLNYKSGESVVSAGRNTRNTIDAVYQIELETEQLENTSDKFARTKSPYYALLTGQNEALLNKNVQSLSDSVKNNPVELEQVNELGKLVSDMEKNIPSAQYATLPADHRPVLNNTTTIDNSINAIMAKAHEIVVEEGKGLVTWRKVANRGRLRALYDNYYIGGVGIIFVIIILGALNRVIVRRKETETKIRESEQKLRRMIEEVGDVIYTSDYNGKFTFINSRLESLTGYTNGELIGKDFKFLVHPEWRQKVKDFYYNQFKNKTHETNYEFPILTREGNTKWVEQNVVIAQNGKLVDGFQCVVRDITRRKKAEEDIRLALEKEKQINELKSRFVSLASHEFRTPLSTILSSTELIGEYIEHVGQNQAFIKDKEIHHLKRIKSAIQNMVTTLNNFLSLDQLEQGKTATNPTDFDVKKLAEGIIDDVHQKLKPGQKIAYAHQSKATDVYIDRTILGNVMLNLVTNAIKYSPENSIVNFTTNVGEYGLEFTVEDHGIGIPETEQDNLFERFFRAKNTLNIEGTGLGLSIVKKYIDLLKGHISFISHEGEGSTFKVFISNAIRPVADDETNLIKQETV